MNPGASLGTDGFAVSGRKEMSPSKTELKCSMADDEAEARQLELDALRRELAAQYREELFARRSEIASQSKDPSNDFAEIGVKRWLDEKADGDVRSFIKTFSEKKEQRKYQLSLIKEYLVDPSRFGPQSDVIPTSTTVEEFEERKRDLSFRVALLKTLLSISEEELRLLQQAEAHARSQIAEDPPA